MPRHYFVDEAGDGTLFSRTGQVLIGNEGVSRFFVLGLLDVENVPALDAGLTSLHQQLMADPYFRGVPSFHPNARKTAMGFHAKDDVPEVRREVFSLLQSTPGLRFFAIVKDKLSVLNYVRQRNQRGRGYRYNPNDLYDFLGRRLFTERLHQDNEYQIYFAKRGKADRTAALEATLGAAKQRFYDKHGIQGANSITVVSAHPPQVSGLQACDYFLWALQRLYERGEDRYLGYLWDSFRLVQDVDDLRQDRYGVYYSQNNPLTADALAWRQ